MRSNIFRNLLAGLFSLLVVPAAAETPLDLYCRELHLPLPALVATAPPPFLGVAYEPAAPPAAAGFSPCPAVPRITSVIRGSAAREAGLLPGDLILAVNGQPVCAAATPAGPDLRAVLGAGRVGEPVLLALLRDGMRRELAVTLGSRARHPAAETLVPDPVCPPGNSRLARALVAQGATERFAQVTAALAARADQLHNLAPDAAESGNPRQLRAFTSLMRHPLRAGLSARRLSDPFLPAAGPAAALGPLAALADIQLESPPPLAEVTLPALVAALETAAARIKGLLARLTPEELQLLRNGILAGEDAAAGEDWNRLLAAALRIDPAAMVAALAPLTGFFTEENLARLRQDLLRRFPKPAVGRLYQAESAAGPILVGGSGNDTYDQDAALILDLGGDDLYRNNAGGSREKMPVALVIDWGGDDRYLARDNLSQGAGLLGGGFLLDLAGRDLFVARDGSQGAGFLGVGLLYHGGRQGIFHSHRLSQGVGRSGLGLLSGGGGDTLYQGGEKGQGFGAWGGAGVLVDSDGADTYQLGGLTPDFRDPQRATVSMGQGFGYGIRPEGEQEGVSGGIGLLLDAGGDDTYLADYFAQGAAYYFGLGILRDLGGNDRYLAGRYAQGAGIHDSVGVLLDQEGDDLYHASVGVAQGLGHDYGFGILHDQGGDDRYDGGSLLQGAATPGGFGLLLDSGGHNQFQAKEKSGGFAEDGTGLGILLQ